MPPHPSASTGQERTSGLPQVSQYDYSRLFQAFLLVLVAVAGLRVAILRYSSGKRRTTLHRAKNSVPEEKELNSPCQGPSEQDLRPQRPPQSTDEQPLAFEPAYPWIAPPRPLPGPYDPSLYPLPTIRRHSYDRSSVETPKDHASITYTRRVSMNNIPTHQSTVHGTMTTSRNGWRRNQWVAFGE